MIKKLKNRKWIKVIAKSGLFDVGFYLHTYPDVRHADIDPVKHYVLFGWKEGRNPNKTFDTNYYLSSNEDVRASKMNPFAHFILYGLKEGRKSALAKLSDEVARNGVRATAGKSVLKLKSKLSERASGIGAGFTDFEHFVFGERSREYADYIEHERIEPEVKVVAFYLPQYHPFPENDQWWGKGFTEWTNVVKARPSFIGHYQPHLPIHNGFYDLRVPEVMLEQARLARNYGIHGFNFYYYWFAGKTLMYKPFEILLEHKNIDINFCITWANENWTRRWDGLEDDILIEQKHSAEDDVAFIESVASLLRDSRYIRVNGKPLLVVYRPSLLPSAKETAQRWRTWCRENNIGEIYLAYTQSFEAVDPDVYGFDAAIEFPPNNSAPPNITGSVTALDDDFQANIYDWRVFLQRSKNYQQKKYKLFRSVCPSWDNTARRKNKGTVFLNSAPSLYRDWLLNAVNETKKNSKSPDERLVFVNAWNEWAEGAHLEPDSYYGYSYLQATHDALISSSDVKERNVLVVTHDCHPHGAQFLILETAKQLKKNGFRVAVLALNGGKLLEDFERIGHTLNAKGDCESEIIGFLNKLWDEGFRDVITSTVVSGQVLPLLKNVGFHVLSLIHELPGVIHNMKQEGNAKAIAQHADKIVFPASLVYEKFLDVAPVAQEKVIIRPQGVLRQNPYKNRLSEARDLVIKKHDLPKDCQIVLSVGFADFRKGVDLFVEIADAVLKKNRNSIFIWVGHDDGDTTREAKKRARQLDITHKVLFVGFDREPMDYYAAASVYALPSREDPFPNVVLESAEVGVPVVAFEGASGACDFVVEQGGRLAKYLDVEDFAEQVRQLLESPRTKPNGTVGTLNEYSLDLIHYLNGFPRVSVVIPNYNYQGYIVERIRSVFEQSFPIYELIVLDDASDDNSVQVIEQEIARAGVGRLVVNDTNSGSVFRQWKKGLSMCRGDLVWIAEADDVAELNFLQELAPAFKDESVVLAFSQSSQIDSDGKVLAKNYLDYTGDISDKWKESYFNDGRLEVAEAMSIKNTIPNASAVLFRRSTLCDVFNDLDDKIYDCRVAGDWLIYIHSLMRGRLYFNSVSLNRHRRHTDSVTNETQKQIHFQEVCDVQDIACKLAQPSPEAVVKARSYREHLKRYFGI